LATTELERLSIDTIRTLSMDAVQKAGVGHPGTAMALAPLAYVLYGEVLRHNPASPHWENRDRFILSAGHACVLQYSALHLTGYNLSLEELKRFRQWNSATPGHPEFRHTEGIEITTGPLGQGFANGVGMAIAERFLADTFNRPKHGAVVDHRVYAICSDGDLMEGLSYEAGSIAGTNGLGKLIYFYDDNHITIDGTTRISFTEDRALRFEALGWHVQTVADVNDLDALRSAIAAAQAEIERPSIVIVHSHIAFGAPHAVDTAKAHGSALGPDEVAATKKALGWDPDKHFYVPDEVYAHLNRVDRGNELETEWRATFDLWSGAFPELREKWDAAYDGRIGTWTPPTFAAGEEIATRDAGKQVMQAFKDAVPTMIGGAADLVESTKTEFEGGGLFSADWSGRNFPFGIREHAMGSIVNGIGAHGGCVKPYGSTFLIFSDYMRPAVRLSALMRLPVLWVWTHDSVGLGEDGPTHQPVETYAALRAIPNLWFMRPADANETAEAWRVALERTDGPVAFSLSRQKVATLDRTDLAPASSLERGAYTLWESSSSPDVILIGTGAEVGLTLAAGRKLAAGGTAVRVVSMPCWELFEAQPADYRNEVLPPDVRARLSVEPGVELGWSKWVGDQGDSISIEHYGASAPGETVLAEFGYNLDNVVARASALLERET
jgi:transketolase